MTPESENGRVSRIKSRKYYYVAAVVATLLLAGLVAFFFAGGRSSPIEESRILATLISYERDSLDKPNVESLTEVRIRIHGTQARATYREPPGKHAHGRGMTDVTLTKTGDVWRVTGENRPLSARSRDWIRSVPVLGRLILR